MESRRSHGMPPFFAHKYQCKHRQRYRKVDQGEGNPSVLEANLNANLNGVETDSEAKELAAKIEQRADLCRLLSVTLLCTSAQAMGYEEARKVHETHLGSISIHNRCRNLEPKTCNGNAKARPNGG